MIKDERLQCVNARHRQAREAAIWFMSGYGLETKYRKVIKEIFKTSGLKIKVRFERLY